RLSRYCRPSRSERMSQPLCSPSKTTPSYFEACRAIAVSISQGAKVVKACWPDSSARIIPLRRGSMDMRSFLANERRSDLLAGMAALYQQRIETRIDTARVALEDLI